MTLQILGPAQCDRLIVLDCEYTAGFGAADSVKIDGLGLGDSIKGILFLPK